MNRILKPLGIAVAVIAALVLAAASVALWFFDADAYKSKLETLVKRETGHELVIGGELSLSLFPGIGVELGHTALRNPPGFGGDNLAEFDALRVKLKLLPLLGGNLAPERVAVKGLEVRLVQNDDGRRNFEAFPASTDPGSDPPPALLALGAVSVEESLISYRDQSTGRTLRLSALNLETDFGSDARTAPLTAQFRFHDSARRFEGEATVNAALSLDNALQTITAQTLSTRMVVQGAGGSGAELVLQSEGRARYDLKTRMLETEAMEIAAENVPAVDQAVNLLLPRASVDLAAGTATVNTLTLRALSLQIAGNFSARSLWTEPALNGALRVENFDPGALAARLLPSEAGLGLPTQPVQGSFETAVIADGKRVALDPVNLTLDGARVSGRIELGLTPQWPVTTALLIEIPERATRESLRMTVRGSGAAADKARVYQIDHLELALGAVSARAKIELDGGSDALAYRASLELPVFSPRALLKTLGQPVPETRDSKVLTRAAAKMTVSGHGAELTLDPLTLQLDDTRIKGSMSVSNGWSAQRAVNFSLHADALDAGRYLPFTMPASEKDAPAVNTLGVLPSMDLNGRLQLGALIVGDLIMDNIELVARSRDGRLELRSGSATPASSRNDRVAGLKLKTAP